MFCPICDNDFSPRTYIQETCSSACSQKRKTLKKTARQRTERAMRPIESSKHYIITDVLPRDLDLLYVMFTVQEMDEALEDHTLPECAQVTLSGTQYEVYTHQAGNGRIFQRLLGSDGKIIMCKAERRISV